MNMSAGWPARALTPDMDRAVVERIDEKLRGIEQTHEVSIRLAIESGSRAWGFASPESDYDCRFIYVRRPARHITLFPERDVIELPVDAVFDVNGWDLSKALLLMLKGNAVVSEWLMSPVVYDADVEFRQGFLDLARQVARRDAIGRHYMHFGRHQLGAGVDADGTIALKKLFYAIRPATALRWMRAHPDAAFPPIHVPTLMHECDPPADVSAAFDTLLAQKLQTSEMGRGRIPDAIATFIAGELAVAEDAFAAHAPPVSDADRAACDAFYGAWVARCA